MSMLEEEPKARPRPQRKITIDVAASFYEEIEGLAVDRDESIGGVVYQALRNELNGSRTGDGFLSS